MIWTETKVGELSQACTLISHSSEWPGAFLSATCCAHPTIKAFIDDGKGLTRGKIEGVRGPWCSEGTGICESLELKSL
jgi:hypothetical protein